jgi:hypothetical protein
MYFRCTLFVNSPRFAVESALMDKVHLKAKSLMGDLSAVLSSSPSIVRAFVPAVFTAFENTALTFRSAKRLGLAHKLPKAILCEPRFSFSWTGNLWALHV